MKKFLSRFISMILSFLVILNSLSIPVFAQSTWDIDAGSWSVVLDNTENPDAGQDTGGVITDGSQWGWQTGQLIDPILNTGVDSQDTGLNSDSSIDGWQSWQVSEFSQDSTPSRDPILAPENATSSPTINPELIISEIFFDWTNEWIEIYNLSSTEFSWDIIISGASASIKNIPNLIIGWLEAKIFTDTSVDSILDTASVFQTNMWFSISDTSDMDIDLIYSWIVLDSVNIDSATVSSLANKISFHRFIDTHNIVASDIAHTDNTTTGYIASPWLVYTEIVPETDPELKITEVYFDGDDERFEITNISSGYNFSGNLSLWWDLNFDISTQIWAGESVVFANDLYSMFQTWENIQIIPILSWWIGEINFDTWAINLDLIRSGQTLDTFYAHETQVEYYTNADTSFEKIWWPSMSPTSRTTTVVWLASDRYYDTNWWIAANPTKYFTTWENLIDVTQAREPVSYEEPLPIDCADFRDDSTANISEVYYWNNLYSPYVELRVQENIYDTYSYIKLEWTALSGTVAFATESSEFSNIDMERNKRILISNSETRYNEWRDSVSDPNFHLTDTWWRLTLYWRDDYGWPDWEWWREILDIIYLNWQNIQTAWNSLYVWGHTNQCADIFDYQDKFSPGLTIWQSQFISITPDPIIQYISVWGGGSCSTKTIEAFNSSSEISQEIQISAIKYFGNLQILKLKNKTNSDIDLRNYKIQSLNWGTQTIKWNTLFKKSTMSFIWNYGFPTKSDYCVNLIKTNSNNKLVDRYCRNSMSKSSILDQQNILNQLSFRIDDTDQNDLPDDSTNSWSGSNWNDDISNPLQTNFIKIIDIDYNPDGSDRDNESITLLLMSWSQVDLSDYILQYIKDWKSTNKKITWILTIGWQQIFKWDFTLPNSTKDKLPVTVNLIMQNKTNNQNYIVDTYIYNPNKITEIPDWNYKVISVIDGDTIKISYANQYFNIRFAGIDAPESSTLRCGKVECFGQEAKMYLKSLLEDQTIRFESSASETTSTQDSFDRFVWYVFLNWENINQKMIKNGYAREFSYKNQHYKYQPDFKLAQDYAQSNSLWLRGNTWGGCNGQRLCPVQETKVTDFKNKYLFNIQDIIYNPEWIDAGNEIIKISMPKWSDINKSSVSFADGFYLMINDKKKSLKNYWSISPWQTKELRWTFSFPNTKKTTVSLINGEVVFDSYVYDPAIDKLMQEELDAELDSQMDSGLTLTWGLQNADISQLWYNISIVSILPNPLWKDSLWEEIWLLYSRQPTAVIANLWNNPYTDGVNFGSLPASQWQLSKINLSSGYYLKIWDKKTYFKNKIKNNNYQLISNQETLLLWNFGLPNKAGCVEIGYKNLIFDKFCYSEPEEWQKFIKSNWVLESINTIDFWILNKAKLQNIWNQVCLTFGSQKFSCKNMPYSKLSVKKTNQNKLYKEFFDSFENYLKDQRKIMYYDTDIKNYFNLLNEIEKAISEWKSEFELNGIKYKTSEFQSMYQSKYPQTTKQVVNQKLSDLIPVAIKNKYNNLLDEYNEYLMRQ